MGDILVFVTGQDDISAAVQLLSEEVHNNGRKSLDLVVLPLYSRLPRAEQDLVFTPTPRGKRKVIISTNIAETSLTLEGMVFVVDSGFSKQRFYDPVSDIENFQFWQCHLYQRLLQDSKLVELVEFDPGTLCQFTAHATDESRRLKGFFATGHVRRRTSVA